MTKRMEIGGYIIVSLEDQLSVEAAIAELLDNAIVAEASYISIALTKRSMMICDNGNGCDDPNLIATPSLSRSRYEQRHIGSKGIGAKHACATFGRVWDIQTCPKGSNKYHHYKVEWDENGPLPQQYAGPARSVQAAPHEIRNGGTKITVTGRREGFPVIRFEKLCAALEARYRPCLNSNVLKITLSTPDSGHRHQLRDAAYDSDLFSGPVMECSGDAAGREFNVRYGVLKEHHRVLSGCHIIFGPRVIKTEDRIGKQMLPSGCYVDVTLSPQWKKYLSTHKDRLVAYSDELFEALENMLATWVSEQKTAASEHKMQLLSGVVSDMLNKSLMFLDPTREGPYQPKPTAHKEKPEDDEEDENEIRIIKRRKKYRRRRKAVLGGTQGIEIDRLSCARISIKPDAKLADQLFRASFSSKEGSDVEIYLNTSRNRLVAELFDQNREADLYKIGVEAFATLVATNPKQFSSLFSGLRARGYKLDDNDPFGDVISVLSNFMFDALYEQRKNARTKRAA